MKEPSKLLLLPISSLSCFRARGSELGLSSCSAVELVLLEQIQVEDLKLALPFYCITPPLT